MNRLLGSVGAIVIVLAAACTTAVPAQLTVLAASSLGNTLPDLSAAWGRTPSYPKLVMSTGATSALRTQIEQGSPADVVLGADTANAQALLDEGYAGGLLIKYATNELTVVVPASNPKGIRTPADLARAGVCVIAAGPEVPITKYAEQLVANLASRPDYGAAFATGYEANVCSREDDVGAVVNKISLGEGDAAIVYVTDARSARNVSTVEVPADSNVVATYGGVAVKASPNGFADEQFLEWLRGSEAQGVLAAHGFGAAP